MKLLKFLKILKILKFLKFLKFLNFFKFLKILNFFIFLKKIEFYFQIFFQIFSNFFSNFQNIFSGFERILDEWDCEQREPNVDDLHQICLDFDLKQFGSGFLSDSRDGIVQVQKVKNVAAPSISQGQYPRMILGFGVILKFYWNY